MEDMMDLPPRVAEAMTSQIEAHPCKGMPDQAFVAGVNSLLERLPAVHLTDHAEVRAVLAQSKTTYVQPLNPETLVKRIGVVERRTEHAPPPLEYTREAGFRVGKRVTIEGTHFTGRTVRFYGVAPDILMGVDIRSASEGQYHRIAQVGFFAEKAGLHAMMSCKEVWYEGPLPYKGYVATGKMFKNFTCYVRKMDKYVPPEISFVDKMSVGDVLCGSKELRRQVDVLSYLKSIGFEVTRESLSRFLLTEVPPVYDIARELNRSSREYCSYHDYTYVQGHHICEKIKCSLCGQMSCPHLTRNLRECIKCKKLGNASGFYGKVCPECFDTKV